MHRNPIATGTPRTLLLAFGLATITMFAAGSGAIAADGVGASPAQWTTPGAPLAIKREYLAHSIEAGDAGLQFDVVEFGTKFAFDELPIDENGMPLYGNPFITQGVIYPPGTVTVDAEGNANGVIVETDAEGNVTVRPEFPELVLGTWICKGTVLAEDGFNIESGPTVYTTQLFDFHAVSGEFGRISVETSGLELIDLNEGIQRAITGGTGAFARAGGEMQQVFVGVNASGGFALRFETNRR